jgi:3-carboxy-cis,cis-muconate cycloisomerase
VPFGYAPPDLATAIEAVRPDDLDLDALGRETALAGVPTIPFVKAVRRLLPPALEPAFHRGATTQDILDTALVLQMRDALSLLAVDLAATLDGFAVLADRHRATPCVGRTYGQQAAPTSFGFKAAIWTAGIADVASELPRIRDRSLTASLGGPVGTLAAFGPDGPALADAFAAELGLASAPISWHTRRARMAEVGLWMAQLIGALSKIATDVVHLASSEVGEVAEPHVPGRGGSSAMPHKRNPVSATVILAAHAAAGGHAATLLSAMAAAHERPAGLWHAEWHALPTLFGLASGALAEGRRLAQGLVVDPARMEANLGSTRGLLFADALAARLAGVIGAAEAHRAVESLADTVREGGLTLREAVERDRHLSGQLSAADLDRAFAVGPAVAAAAGWVDRAIAESARVVADIGSIGAKE